MVCTKALSLCIAHMLNITSDILFQDNAGTLCSNVNCTATRRVDVQVTLKIVRFDIYHILLVKNGCPLVERDVAFKN